MKRLFKFFLGLSTVVSSLVAVPVTVFAEEAPVETSEINLEGYTPPGYTSDDISVFANFPSSYSSKTTSIRNQGSWGTCWSFSTMAQAESYMINAKGVSTDIDLSERQLAYFYYNNVDDPLNNTPNDSTSLSSGYQFYNAGGNPYACYLFLSGYCGIVSEEDVPYKTSDTSATASKYAFDNDYIVLRNAYFLGDNASESTIKQAITDYGGVNAMYYYGSSYYDSSSGSYYCNAKRSVNHAVCIVGWDDNYSKSKFKKQPSSNGAWKVKNSWGTSLGDNGYDWISYEDLTLSGFIAAEYDDKYDAYDYNYHYDGTGGVASVSGSSGIKFANIYEVKGNSSGDEQLEAVSFALNSTNVSYSIQIYTNLTDTSNPESGKAALSSPVTGKTSYAGVYTVDLNKSVDLGESSYYSIVITFTTSDGSSVSMFCDTDHTSGVITYKTGAKKGQSFHKTSSGTWTDAYSNNRCYRIKGLTNNTDEADKNINDAIIKLDKSSYSYTGSAIKPAVTITYGTRKLVEGTDYKVSYSNNTNIGTGTITITGLNSFKGSSATVHFSITGTSLSGCSMTLGTSSFTYDGNAKKPTVVIKNGSSTVGSSNYSVSYSNNTSAGTATVKATGVGNYTGTLTKTFAINPQSISGFKITLGSTSYTYDGTAHKPSVVLKNGNTTISSSNYTVSYSNNTNVGTGKVTVTGKGNYTGTLTATFTIKEKTTVKNISSTSISLSSSSFTYDGNAKKPSVTVKDGSTTLKNGTDYTVSYSSNVNAGTGKVTITGKGNYTGSASKTFSIKAKSISGASISTISNQTYTGSAMKPKPTVKVSGQTLKNETDYTLSYSNNKSVGTATVKISGKGNYAGSVSKTFKINAKSISNLSFSSISNKTYTGSAIKPGITIKNGSVTLKSGIDYSVSYSNNKSTGKATIKITGKGNYTGTKKIYFYIVPKQVTISKVTAAKKAATVKYKKATGASGYRIAYRVKGTSKWKTTTTTSLSKKLTGLTSKKTYQVKVRAYKTVSSKKYYGSYSSVKTVKVN